MQFMVKALTRSKRLSAYVFVDANTEQQAIDFAIKNKLLDSKSYSFSAQEIKSSSAVLHQNTLQFKQQFNTYFLLPCI